MPYLLLVYVDIMKNQKKEYIIRVIIFQKKIGLNYLGIFCHICLTTVGCSYVCVAHKN